MSGLSIKDISKSFSEKYVLKDLTFQVCPGEITVLLGPSGCGKSTLLSIIAGLIKQDRGIISWDGKNIVNLPPHKRNFGLMFQDYVLFPHMNVAQNIGFALKMASWSPEEIKKRINALLNLIGMAGYENRDVSTLSGGEQQRVALARSLAIQPQLLMLDEPLGSLDRKLRENLLFEMSQILREVNQTTLYVTHDQQEAFSIADKLVIIQQGMLEQIGVPQEIYQQPNSSFVAAFLGFNNILDASIHNADNKLIASTQLGDFEVPKGIHGPIKLLIRPDQMHLQPICENKLSGTLVRKQFMGNYLRVVVEISGLELSFDFPTGQTKLPDIGEEIQLWFDPKESIQVLIN